MTENTLSSSDGRTWEPAVPLPWFGLLHVSCVCGKRFWGRRRRAEARYRGHYRARHILRRGR